MEIIKNSVKILAEASNGNPVITTVVVILFYVMFNHVLAAMERLVFGERFEHWLDPVFVSCFIAYAAYTIYACAVYNSRGER